MATTATTVVLVICLLHSSAEACMGAFAYRTLPLGMVDDDVVAVELELYRNSDEDMQNEYWVGSAALVRMSLDGRIEATLSSSIEVNTENQPYSIGLQPILTTLYEQAQKLPGFAEFSTPIIDHCEHHNICQNIRLRTGLKGDMDILVQDDGNSSLPVTYPENFLKHEQKSWGGETLEETERLFEKKLAEAALIRKNPPPNEDIEQLRRFEFAYRIESVRHYSLNGHHILVVNLARGDFGGGYDPDLRIGVDPRRCDADTISECTPFPNTLHHGTSFEILLTIP